MRSSSSSLTGATLRMLAVALLPALGCSRPEPAPSAEATVSPLERGRYLATIGGCNDCHTPKVMTELGPRLDTTRMLSGHPATDQVPPAPPGIPNPAGWIAATNAHLSAWLGPWGVSYAANLTPDTTGLGGWTADVFIATMRTGKHAGVGRPILPPMPWESIAQMTDEDLRALFTFLQSLPPITNRVPPPVPPAGAPR